MFEALKRQELQVYITIPFVEEEVRDVFVYRLRGDLISDYGWI